MKQKISTYLSCLLTLVFLGNVIAHQSDVQKCFIEHFLDFHLDHEITKTPDQKEKEIESKIERENLKDLKQWAAKYKWGCNIDRDRSDDNEGTITDRDNNDSNRDR